MNFLKDYILKQVASGSLNPKDAVQMLEEMKTRTEEESDEVAIIGMACKFPKADDIYSYWSKLKEGKECIMDFPADREKDIMHINKSENGKKNVYNKAGYITDVDKFDPKFFHLSPREAKFIDPVHRLFLEIAYKTLENAGYGGKKAWGTKTGVYVGNDFTNVSMYKYITEADPMHLTGSWSGLLATRIMYILNLKGPGMVIDTACSSGLTAIHQACEALRSHSCDMALAGGICLGLVPSPKDLDTSMSMIESEDYKVRVFDAKANGTVWGEGTGVVLLKPLKKALMDRDNIWAIIKGSAINNDGRSNGITAPNAEAQEKVILQAWKNSKISPETISYIETHGTGTILGDPIEVNALTRAFRKYTNKKQFCGIGSVKPNIGHLVGASGMASLIKVILAMKNEVIPPSINFNELNPYINLCDSPLYFNDRLTKWPKGDLPRRAGISTFGFSGTNCHIVLEENIHILKRDETKREQPSILPLSAYSRNCLLELVKQYDHFEFEDKTTIEDICYTASTGRGHYDYRLAIIASNTKELKEKINFIRQDVLKSIPEKGIYYQENDVENHTSDSSKEQSKEEMLRQITSHVNLLIQEQKDSNLSDNMLHEVYNAYVNGADVDWGELYKSKEAKIVCLPEYPFDKIRCWANPRVDKIMMKDNTKERENYESLLGKPAIDSIYQTIYVNQLSEKNWEVNEHKVAGRKVLVGTAYLEMMIAAANKYYHTLSLELRNIIFHTPCTLEVDEKKEIQVIADNGNDYLKITVASKKDEVDETGSKWIKHATCEAYIYDLEEKQYDIEALMKQCNKKTQAYHLPSETGVMDLGERWASLKKGWIGIHDILAEIALPEAYRSDMYHYYFHPALNDCSSILSLWGKEKSIYLPLTYQSFKISKKLPEKFYSYIHFNNNEEQGQEIKSFNIELLDEHGNVFTKVENYTAKRVHKDNFIEHNNSYYQMSWKSVHAPDGIVCNHKILVFKNLLPLCQQLIEELKAYKNEVIEVAFAQQYQKTGENTYTINGSEEDYNKLFQSISADGVDYIIHLAQMNDENQDVSLQTLRTQEERSIYRLLRCTRSLAKNAINNVINILIAADFANEVTKEERMIKPCNAAMFGLAKVLNEEYSNMNIKCMDTDLLVNEESIIHELDFNDEQHVVAYRNGKRYIEELVEVDITKQKKKTVEIKQDGVYIITGGVGGVGTAIGKYMASKNYVNLAIIGRSKLENHQDGQENNHKLTHKIKNMEELHRLSANVKYYSADVTDYESMKIILNDLRKQYQKINGVLHCAGVASDKFAIRQSEEDFMKGIAPKIEGTWILNQLTKEDNLDFFIMFSSAATLYGVVGQSNYTAGNAYLDSFASYREKYRQGTLTIDWPAWNEVGMAVDYGTIDNEGAFRTISTAKALSIFEEVLEFQVSRVIPVELNYSVLNQIKGKYPFKLADSIQQKVNYYGRNGINLENVHSPSSKSKTINLRDKEIVEYSKIETELTKILGEVLDITELDIYDDFNNLGGNSILAIQLLKEIEQIYPGYLNISDIFTYSSVTKLAKYIEDKMRENEQEGKENSENTKELSDVALQKLLDEVEEGNTTTNQGLEILLGKRMDESDE